MINKINFLVILCSTILTQVYAAEYVLTLTLDPNSIADYAYLTIADKSGKAIIQNQVITKSTSTIKKEPTSVTVNNKGPFSIVYISSNVGTLEKNLAHGLGKIILDKNNTNFSICIDDKSGSKCPKPDQNNIITSPNWPNITLTEN